MQLLSYFINSVKLDSIMNGAQPCNESSMISITLPILIILSIFTATVKNAYKCPYC